MTDDPIEQWINSEPTDRHPRYPKPTTSRWGELQVHSPHSATLTQITTDADGLPIHTEKIPMVPAAGGLGWVRADTGGTQ